MALTLKNYATTLSPDLILQAKKNKVRECDETENGHFVAYVDDGNESFDVSLIIRGNKEITQHACECNSTAGFCRHKAALIIHIAQGDKAKDIVKVKVKKKENKVDSLLDDIDPKELKAWVKGLIDKNKDIELSFVHHFSVKEQLTPVEVAKIVDDAVKAVIGNKKAIDLTQLKKLVELWSEMLAPIVTRYRENVTDEKSFVNFHTMIETCITIQLKVDSNSNKIPKFIEEALQKSVEPVGVLQVEETWEKAVSYFVDHVPDRINSIRMHYLIHLENIINISNEDRKVKIIDWLAKQFGRSKPDTLMNGTPYCKFIFKLAEGHNLVPKYRQLFKPIRFDNDYNQKIIRLLIENNDLEQAKKYCDEQMGYNFRDEYNVLYLKFLREIHLIQKDEEALAKVLATLFPFTFDFDDYLFISERLPEEERKKWRNKMLTKSRNVSYNKTYAIEFYFKLIDFEQSYRKMIDYIDSNTPYSIITQYFEKMVQADKNRFLEVILLKSDDYGWSTSYESKQKDKVYFPELFRLFEKYYHADYLKMVIRNAEKTRMYYRPNDLIIYIREQLLSNEK